MKNEKDYIEYFRKTVQKRNAYLQRRNIENKFLKKKYDFNNDFFSKIKQDYNNLVFNSIELERKFSSDDRYCSLFFNPTLDTEYHEFIKSPTLENKLIKNRKFIEGNTINLGYRVLNSFFIKLLKDFKVDNKYQKIYYLKAMEPHLGGTVHLHSVLYLKEIHLEKFLEYLKNKVKITKGIGRYTIEQINNIHRTSSYILKYMQKNYKKENDNFEAYYGWKLKNKIRAYTFSKTSLPRDVFDKISFSMSKSVVHDKDFYDHFGTDNYLKIVDMFTTITSTTVDMQTGEITSSIRYASEDSVFRVELYKERYLRTNIHQEKIEIINELNIDQNRSLIISELKKIQLYNSFKMFVFKETKTNDLNLENDNFFTFINKFLKELVEVQRYQYKIKSYKIYKRYQNNKSELIYNKDDWRLVAS